jgi:hypothetical protein
MPQLSDEELRALITEAEPNAVLDDDTADDTWSVELPPSVRHVADRAELAQKLARLNGLDAVGEPAPLRDDESVFGGRTMLGPGGQWTQATVYSAQTGRSIAEQG